jgi:hypothetical protein
MEWRRSAEEEIQLIIISKIIEREHHGSRIKFSLGHDGVELRDHANFLTGMWKSMRHDGMTDQESRFKTKLYSLGSAARNRSIVEGGVGTRR